MPRLTWIGMSIVGVVVALVISTAHMRAADAPATAAGPTSHSAIDPIITELVNLAGEGRIDQMLDRIGATPEPDREAIERARERLMVVYNNAGKYHGFDVAGFKSLTPRFQVAYVLAYYDRRPVMYEIGFYQLDGKWRPQTFNVETDFRAVLDTMPLQK